MEEPWSLAKGFWDLRWRVHENRQKSAGRPPRRAQGAYFIWYRLLVPRWSMSWHRPAVTMANASRSV